MKTSDRLILLNHLLYFSICCCSVAKLCPTVCNPMDFSIPGFPVLHCLPELLKFMSIDFAMIFNHLILCYLLLPLPSIFPSIKVFSSESPLCTRWPKYWSFGFSFSLFNEYAGLISFRIDWFDLLTGKKPLWWSLSVTNNNMTFSVFDWQFLWICH